jgi:putative tryptophan/tyrosine transport system substrate-binding protein
MTVTIGRRELLAALGGAVAAWPLAARAQQPAMPVVGFLRSASLANATPLVSAFRQGLKEAGYIEGQNVAVEFRSAEGHNDQLPRLVGDLVRRQVAVIVCNVTAASAAKAVTLTVPIVFATGDDPIAEGLVTSLNRPGGNITGVSFLGNALGAKQVELLHELLPKATTLAVLVDTNYQGSVSGVTDVEAAALTRAAAYRLACQRRPRSRERLGNSGSAARRRAYCPRRCVLS